MKKRQLPSQQYTTFVALSKRIFNRQGREALAELLLRRGTAHDIQWATEILRDDEQVSPPQDGTEGKEG